MFASSLRLSNSTVQVLGFLLLLAMYGPVHLSAQESETSTSAKKTAVKSQAVTVGVVQEKPRYGRYVKIANGYMVPYKQTIPGTNQFLWMEPIPASKRKTSDQQGLFSKSTPFWMARYETRHGDYLPYMRLYRVFQEFEKKRIRPLDPNSRVDAVSAPTEIYDPGFAFEYGVDMEHPVGTMTQFCARQYTKWLSLLTELEFRLPTEEEWEHACSAGTTTAWHFGDNPAKLSEYANFDSKNESPGYEKVGQRRANAWGLYDMHGNMAEWVLRPGITKPGRQVLKGGCWEFPANKCRVTSVLKFDDDKFRDYDPMYPQSPWWLASYESRWVGFRIIRPLQKMSSKEREFAWECYTEEEQIALEQSVESGRGVIGRVNEELPDAIRRFGPKR